MVQGNRWLHSTYRTQLGKHAKKDTFQAITDYQNVLIYTQACLPFPNGGQQAKLTAKRLRRITRLEERRHHVTYQGQRHKDRSSRCLLSNNSSPSIAQAKQWTCIPRPDGSPAIYHACSLKMASPAQNQRVCATGLRPTRMASHTPEAGGHTGGRLTADNLPEGKLEGCNDLYQHRQFQWRRYNQTHRLCGQGVFFSLLGSC